MLINLSYPVTQRLINLFNNIINRHIPQQFKNRTVIPIQKPNSVKTAVSSYRPISLNPCMAKVLDKIVATRLWWFATNCKLLEPWLSKRYVDI